MNHQQAQDGRTSDKDGDDDDNNNNNNNNSEINTTATTSSGDSSIQQGQQQQQQQQPPQDGRPSSSFSFSFPASSLSSPPPPPPAIPAHSTHLTLPPIPSFYNFVSADTASAPERFLRRHHHHHNSHRPYRDADQASFNTWTSPPPPALYSLSGRHPAPPPTYVTGPGTGGRGAAVHNSNSNITNEDTGSNDDRGTSQEEEEEEEEEEEHGGEDDFDYDDDDDDDTNFVFEHGRRYHANNGGRAFYPLPNDELEQERDDMKHNLALWMMHDKLFYAPVDEALRRGGVVFDLGTGTGTWAMELAKVYTTSQIHGCDLSPIQPAYVWDNVFFATGDFEDEATWDEYPDGAFDYIHMRYTLFAVQDPAALIQRAWKHLKPGGYLEFQEILYWPQADDNSLGPDTPYAFRDFCYYMQQALARLTTPGMDLHAINRVAELMRSLTAPTTDPTTTTMTTSIFPTSFDPVTGTPYATATATATTSTSTSQQPQPALFNDITEVRHKLPIGRWPASRRQREKGIWFLRMVILEGLGAFCKRAFVKGLGWTEVQVEMFLFEVRRSLLEWDGGGHGARGGGGGGGGGGRGMGRLESGMDGVGGGVHAYLPFTVVYGRKPLVQGQGEERQGQRGQEVVMGGV